MTTNKRISFKEACEIYIHRFTMDHIPAWAANPMADGKYYAPQFRSDAEWYANTLFTGESGIPHPDWIGCYTTGQTWPLGKSLTRPYKRELPRRSERFLESSDYYVMFRCVREGRNAFIG